ncbi:hypothetical protein MRI28_17100 [Nocardiopsis dassonvillei]|uniref:hypothetical protein n=1 Tax=Nocardiopsis dassonvillei TaxID=2014 RepID=UPI00200D891B|nr:hypothetical protein [Nocardiopsis dassonvillei]MCK9871333.1 hypothetical protein [Nocardiopsis dassonvillei]
MIEEATRWRVCVDQALAGLQRARAHSILPAVRDPDAAVVHAAVSLWRQEDGERSDFGLGAPRWDPPVGATLYEQAVLARVFGASEGRLLRHQREAMQVLRHIELPEPWHRSDDGRPWECHDLERRVPGLVCPVCAATAGLRIEWDGSGVFACCPTGHARWSPFPGVTCGVQAARFQQLTGRDHPRIQMSWDDLPYGMA